MMDLLQEYDSDSENDREEVDQDRNKYKKRRTNLNTDTSSTHTHTSSKTNNIKNNLPISTEESTSTSSNSDSLNKIKLLSSPNEINFYPTHAFQRSQPHIHGNWAGNIYISLNKSNAVCTRTHNTSNATGITHGNDNHSYNRLKQYACSKINTFYHRIIEIAKEQEFEDEIVIVPHVNMNTGINNADSSNDDDSDGDSESESDSDSESDNDNDKDNKKECKEEQSKSDENKNEKRYGKGLHISLAKPFFLQQQFIQPFLKDLKRQLSILQPMVIRFGNKNPKTKSTNLGLGLEQQQQQILINDNQTRSFLTMPVCEDDTGQLLDIVNAVDSIMIKYGMDRYYTDPKFHCSIASWKGTYDWISYGNLSSTRGKSNVIENESDDKKSRESNQMGYDAEQFTFVISGIHCNFGTTENHFLPFNSMYR